MKKAGLIALLCCLLGFLTIRSCELSEDNISQVVKTKVKELKLREKIINREIKEIIRHRSVMVTTSTGVGTGVIVSPNGYIITAKHVPGDRCDPSLKIMLDDLTEVGPGNVDVIFSHEKADFALLKINKQTLNFAPLVSVAEMRTIDGGDKLWLCGNSYTLSFLLINEISFLTGDHSPTATPIEQRLFYFDDFNGPGGSGGGVFTKTGGLAGMYLGATSIPGFPPAGRALHVDSIRYFLEQNQVGFKTLADYSNL